MTGEQLINLFYLCLGALTATVTLCVCLVLIALAVAALRSQRKK